MFLFLFDLHYILLFWDDTKTTVVGSELFNYPFNQIISQTTSFDTFLSVTKISGAEEEQQPLAEES